MKNLIFDFDLKFLSNSDVNQILKFLKITNIGIETPIKEILNITNLEKIDKFSKLTLREADGINTKNLKMKLSENRKKYHIIIVEPLSAGVAAIAARDRRVDAVKISKKSMLKVFNTRYGRRLSENNKFVIIDLDIFWDSHLAKNLRPLLRVLRSFSNCSLQYVMTKNSENIFDMRTYRGLQSIGRLLDISNQQSNLKPLSDLIEKNQKKINGKIPLEGVEIIEW